MSVKSFIAVVALGVKVVKHFFSSALIVGENKLECSSFSSLLD
jgi:hypothetical protein